MLNNRRSIRLKEYDYSQSGAYFVTICTQDRECIFSEIADGQIILNDAAKMVDEKWRELKIRFPHIELDEYVIMPNHLHGIITVGAGSSCPDETMETACSDGRENRAPTLGQIVAYFKYQTTKQINAARNVGIQRLWQRNYYERVIRDEDELNVVRQYIIDNPAKWDTDEENPNVKPSRT